MLSSEEKRLAPLIAETNQFTSKLALASLGATFELIKRGEGRNWKACPTIGVHKLANYVIKPDGVIGAHIYSLTVHQTYTAPKFLWPQKIQTSFINVHARLFTDESSTIVNGVLTSRGDARMNSIFMAQDEANAANKRASCPAEHLTSLHLGRLASGLRIAEAINTLASLEETVKGHVVVPDSMPLLDKWRNATPSAPERVSRLFGETSLIRPRISPILGGGTRRRVSVSMVPTTKSVFPKH